MASVSGNGSNAVITCGAKAVVLGLCNDSDRTPSPIVLEPPNVQGNQAETTEDCENSEDKQNDAGSQATVILASFSSCNKWLVLCSSNKQLSLWHTGDWSLISNRTLNRAASAVKFTPSGRFIVVADKSGDAYQYSVEQPSEEGILLLGHLSMLLDILVTPDEKYVITCDRDEKIRVSKFPNAYNIQCYCLGHAQFVTHLSLLPHNSSVLVSSSGDGTIMFWDYLSGKQYYTENCSRQWQLSNLNASNTTDSLVSTELPIKYFTCFKVEDNASLLCALLSGANVCLIYNVCHKLGNIHCEGFQTINLGTEPWDVFLMSAKHLWILSPQDKELLCVFVRNTFTSNFVLDNALLDASITSGVSFVNERNDMFAASSTLKPINILYKRTFSNIEDYHERKKKRLTARAKCVT